MRYPAANEAVPATVKLTVASKRPRWPGKTAGPVMGGGASWWKRTRKETQHSAELCLAKHICISNVLEHLLHDRLQSTLSISVSCSVSLRLD